MRQYEIIGSICHTIFILFSDSYGVDLYNTRRSLLFTEVVCYTPYGFFHNESGI